jgi:glycosyltransferase involved in cell wall biosynthesis
MIVQLQNITYYPAIGGVETHIQYSAEYFIKYGDIAKVLCYQHLPTLASEEIINGVSVIRHPDYRLPTPFSVLNPMIQVKKVRSFLKKKPMDTDVIWAGHSYYALASKQALPETPIIFFQSTLFPALLKHSYKNLPYLEKVGFKLWNFQNMLIEKTVLSNMDAIVTLSQMRKRETLDFTKSQIDKFFVIPPGVDIEKFKPRPKEMKLMEEFRLPPQSKVILTACRLSPEKNLKNLILAFSMIQDNETYLVIVGDGEERSYLEKLAISLNVLHKIRFCGFRSDIERFYAIADVFVLPSLYEGYGLVYLEAMASGVPCIGLKAKYPDIIVATEEIIEEGVTGYCVDPFSIIDLKEKICAILFDSVLRNEMSLNARNSCVKNYTWDQHIIKMKEIIKGII